MGGVVSPGHNNDHLIDNLKEADYIKSEKVEQVFRIVDRAHYYLEECRDGAYKDLAWKNGTLHLSAPCIYSEVMEALELRQGLSFLNLGSGTGYLNTMVGYMIGPNGINHGIELHASNVAFAEQRLKEFRESSPRFDDLELCKPSFVEGNCLNLAPDNRRYDRVYCGAACPSELTKTVQNMIKIDGILVVPVGDQLLKIRRVSETDFSSENVLPVSFASLVEPSNPKNVQDLIVLPEVDPLSLQDICCITIREAIRSTFTFEKHQPKNSQNSSRQSGLLRSSRVFRQERGRYPLNILPTSQGLMIMGAFSDDSDASDTSDQFDGVFLDEQLQRHAQVRRQNVDTAEIDSALSDEEKNGNEKSLNGAEKFDKKDRCQHSTHDQQESLESEDGIVADDEGDGTEVEMTDRTMEKDIKEGTDVDTENACTCKEEGKSMSGKSGPNKSNNAKRLKGITIERKPRDEMKEAPKSTMNHASMSSDDEVLGQQSNASASPVTDFFDSKPRTIKTSYSTSAETSETSGFGSLGEDQIHTIGSLQSGFENLDDDSVMKNEGTSDDVHISSSPTVDNSNSKTGEHFYLHFPHPSDSSDDIDTANDDDEEEESVDETDDEDNEMEAPWTDSDDNHFYQMWKKDLKGKNENGEGEDVEMQPSPLPPNGFTVFLKKQVDTLPIPNTMKNYICHFR